MRGRRPRIETLTLLTPILGALGMLFALLVYGDIVRRPAGSQRMVEIASSIQAGAMAYLKR